jgi:phosphohistidine phosphatase SixA/flavodoxin
LENCRAQRNLTQQGRSDARAIGQALQTLGVPAGQVLASPYCRTLDTARLAFGRAEPSRELLPTIAAAADREQLVAGLRRLLGTQPPAGVNTILVSHQSILQDATGVAIAEGEAAVFGPGGANGFGLVARVLPNAWATLVRPAAAGTTPEPAPPVPSPARSKVLLAYFSRAGENYHYGGRTELAVGNTEVLAGMIGGLIGCEVHRIEPADPYPHDYAETVGRNVREQRANARPAIANPLASVAQYDVVLLGSPIWNVRAPMIMSTFAESLAFTGKTVVPFVTYAVSGLGTAARDYAAWCPGATIGEGLAVRGEEVRDAGPAVESWLRRVGLHEG